MRWCSTTAIRVTRCIWWSRAGSAIRITTPLGDVATLRVLGPGEHFGELAVLAPGPRRGSVVALEAAETLSLHRDDIHRLSSSRAGTRAPCQAALGQLQSAWRPTDPTFRDRNFQSCRGTH